MTLNIFIQKCIEGIKKEKKTYLQMCLRIQFSISGFIISKQVRIVHMHEHAMFFGGFSAKFEAKCNIKVSKKNAILKMCL
jgi:hypothetical protein